VRSFAPEIATVLVGHGGQMPARQMFLFGVFCCARVAALVEFHPGFKELLFGDAINRTGS
jgi:hypothetical protein